MKDNEKKINKTEETKPEEQGKMLSDEELAEVTGGGAAIAGLALAMTG